MSLWADYLNECELLEIIEEPYGFVTFSLLEPATCVIHDMYVAPTERKSRKGSSLLEKVEEFALLHGCEEIQSAIHIESAMAPIAQKASLAAGFTVREITDRYIIIGKDLKGDSHG